MTTHHMKCANIHSIHPLFCEEVKRPERKTEKEHFHSHPCFQNPRPVYLNSVSLFPDTYALQVAANHDVHQQISHVAS